MTFAVNLILLSTVSELLKTKSLADENSVRKNMVDMQDAINDDMDDDMDEEMDDVDLVRDAMADTEVDNFTAGEADMAEDIAMVDMV